MLGRWDERLIDQASDVASIIFFQNFLQNFLQKFFQFFFFFYNFTKIKIKSLECPKSIRTLKKCLEHQMLGRWVIRPSIPATQHIILKIVGFSSQALSFSWSLLLGLLKGFFGISCQQLVLLSSLRANIFESGPSFNLIYNLVSVGTCLKIFMGLDLGSLSKM